MFERKRILGIKRELDKRNISWEQNNILEAGASGKGIVLGIKEILKGKSEVDSIICTNNIAAYHVLKELKKGGKKIPEDIGVITFDNYPLAEYMEPALTVVDIDTYKLGEAAAKALFDKMGKGEKKSKNVLIPTRIIKRKSTKKG